MRSFRTRMRSFRSTRRKPKTFWVRQAFANVAPAATNNVDLLLGYITTVGIAALSQEYVLLRLHLAIAVTFTVTTAGANNGVSVASWVDSKNQVQLSAQAAPYDQQYLVFDEMFVGESLQQGGTTPFNIVHRYDVRAKRRIPSITDTVFLQLAAVGTATLTSYSVVQSMLIKTS